MTDIHTSPITQDALNEFIRQLFVCHWVLGQMITAMLERAQSEEQNPDQEPVPDDAYSMIRGAIRVVVDRHSAREIVAAANLIDEVMDAISDDGRIFPKDPAVTALADCESRRPPVRRRRR